MIKTKNKFLIAAYINDNQENIIAKYEQDMPINTIAKLYGVSRSIIYLRLVKWGVTIRKYTGARRRKDERMSGQGHYKRHFSKEFLAKREENTRINNAQITYIEFKNSTEDQVLVENIILRPIIG